MEDLHGVLFAPEMGSDGVLLSMAEVCARTKLGRTTIYKLMDDPDSGFPPPIKILGQRGKGGGKVVFFRAMIDAWLRQRMVRDADADALAAAVRAMTALAPAKKAGDAE
ncbi:MAG: helix-turn-helix transcriptional regulator [Thiomonas sp.]